MMAQVDKIFIIFILCRALIGKIVYNSTFGVKIKKKKDDGAHSR